MQISNSDNSINTFQALSQQMNNQFTYEVLKDQNLSLNNNHNNLYDKEENQKDEMTFSKQGNLFNVNHPYFYEDRKIQIFVQIPNGRILSFDVNKNEEYLQQITGQILQREGIPPDRQKLYLGPKFLNKINSKTIQKNSTLHLKINCSNNIIVIYNNKRHIIKVNLNDCVCEIKHQLSINFNYPINSQVLYYKNIQLQENIKLFYYKIQKHSIVLLKLKNLIYINQASKNRKIMVNLDEKLTIKNLKTRLNQKYCDLGDFHLIYKNQILKNENLLLFYDISDFSILELVELKYIKFSIQTQSISLQIKKEQYETIQDIKNEIESQSKFPVDKQHLFYKGKELESNLRIVDCNIEEDSKLYLFNNLKTLYEITIIDSDDFDDFIIKINPNNKVYELKQKISDNYSLMSPDFYILRYNGKILKDEKDLSYYNIQNFDIIFIESQI
ncbi:unnamed protein product [Paramecium sonneborni]|uniref:Ubiquitin-like domain-containing protein n=1 Tax=Paramecium sonneborni TaxID=65129 RepID=A0A8S1MJU0_9CILI|nr:unnamed protein product [Paramecium sonneborni]